MNKMERKQYNIEEFKRQLHERHLMFLQQGGIPKSLAEEIFTQDEIDEQYSIKRQTRRSVIYLRVLAVAASFLIIASSISWLYTNSISSGISSGIIEIAVKSENVGSHRYKSDLTYFLSTDSILDKSDLSANGENEIDELNFTHRIIDNELNLKEESTEYNNGEVIKIEVNGDPTSRQFDEENPHIALKLVEYESENKANIRAGNSMSDSYSFSTDPITFYDTLNENYDIKDLSSIVTTDFLSKLDIKEGIEKPQSFEIGIFAPSYKKPISQEYAFSELRSQFSPLKYSKKEAELINKIIQAHSFIGEEASKVQLIKNSGKFGILHLATHAKSNRLKGDYSFFAFSDSSEVNSLDNIIYANQLHDYTTMDQGNYPSSKAFTFGINVSFSSGTEILKTLPRINYGEIESLFCDTLDIIKYSSSHLSRVEHSLFQAANNILSTAIVEPGNSIVYQSEGSIRLLPGHNSKKGSIMHSRIASVKANQTIRSLTQNK